MANLLSLPLELLVHISSLVSTADLAALRLTCKQTEKSLYEWFSEEFFVKKQFMLTHPSLQVLLDISRHASLSKKLKHLIIATTVYDDGPIRFRDSDACSSYIQGYADQQALINNGIDREMLTEAFKGLSNLETVDIRDFCAKRERDGTYWASWGATTVNQQTQVRLRESYRGTGSQSRFVSHVFSNLLYSMGVAGRTPPRIEVLLRNQSAGLPDSAFHLANFTFPAIQPVLYNLKALFLTLDFSIFPSHVLDTYPGQAPITRGTTTVAGWSLRHFLSCTPNLTHLRLNFQKSQTDYNMEFMEWLALSPALPVGPPQPRKTALEEPSPINLPHLTALEIGQLDVNFNILLAVLSRFAPKLQRLSLWRMTMDAGPSGPYNAKPNIWSQFFRALDSISGPNLAYLKVGALTQLRNTVEFKTMIGGTQKSEMMREYSGKNMAEFINSLANDVAVQFDPDMSSSDEDDDDQDMYDDEDGEDEEEDDEEDDDE